jgi:hypothetical protein
MSDWITPAEAWRRIGDAIAGIDTEGGGLAAACHAIIPSHETIGRLLLTELLRTGQWTAIGYSGPDDDATSIPPRHWLFMSLDIERATAAAPQHGLSYAGIRVDCRQTAMPVQAPWFTAKDESGCLAWLVSEISSGRCDGIPKHTVQMRAQKLFKISGKGFSRNWSEAIEQTGRNDLTKAGRKS